MDWETVWADLESAFSRIADAVEARVPGIGTRVSRGPTSPATVFNAQVTFAHLPLNAPVEDVLMGLTCGPSATGGFYAANGELLFPAADEQNAIKCEIERGNGEVLARLNPMLLPADEDSDDYWEAVHGFVAAAKNFGERNIDTITFALSHHGH